MTNTFPQTFSIKRKAADQSYRETSQSTLNDALKVEIVPIEMNAQIGSLLKRVTRLPERAPNIFATTGPAREDFSTACLRALKSKTTWADKEYRHAYACSAVEQGIAWQVRINREARGLSQRELADAIGTKQSSISRMEDPEYGSHSLTTLLKVAEVFDCALLVKLVPYSILAAESRNLGVEKQYAAPYTEEIGEHNE